MDKQIHHSDEVAFTEPVVVQYAAPVTLKQSGLGIAHSSSHLFLTYYLHSRKDVTIKVV